MRPAFDMEVIVAILAVIWVASFYVEKKAGATEGYGKYAWLALALRRLLLFGGLGVFLISVGTDWHNRFWERTVGITCILVGVGLFVRAISRRREIQEDLTFRHAKLTGVE